MTATSETSYQVTSALPCGALIMNENIYNKWLDIPQLEPLVKELVDKHNSRFNAEGKCLVADTEQPDAGEKPSSLRKIKLASDEAITQEQLTSLETPMTLQVTNVFKLVAEVGKAIYAVADEPVTLMNKELFSFGSGAFLDNMDAKETMDTDSNLAAILKLKAMSQIVTL